MAYYDIDTEKFIKDNAPARKRMQFPVLDYLLKGLLNAFTRWVSIFKKYKEGYTTFWNNSTTYNYGDCVAWDGKVYECYVNSTTANPSDSTRWRLLFDLWRGTNEGQQYNGTVMQLEYALNRYYNLTFSAVPMASDIYIVTNTIPDPVFAVGTDDNNTSAVGLEISDGFVPLTYATALLPASFTIHVPLIWYITLSSNPDQKIQAFVSQYVTKGVTYSITTY